MAEGKAQKPLDSCRTICLPIAEETYPEIVEDPQKFREWLEEAFQQMPEVFPDGFKHGFSMKDRRPSAGAHKTLMALSPHKSLRSDTLDIGNFVLGFQPS